MTGLLVSVRDVRESLVAWQAGVDLLDIKEPLRGSLGAADPAAWLAIRSAISDSDQRNSHPGMLSAACGELVEFLEPRRDALCGFQFAKVGLAGCSGLASWPDQWRSWAESLPAGTKPVGVAYADDVRAGSPSPREVLERTAELGGRMFLIDTFDKSGGDLFDCLGEHQLRELSDLCRDLEVGLVLAGSLGFDTIPRALEFDPDFVAVRGAACVGGREGQIDGGRVVRLRRLVRPTPALETRYTS